MNEIMEFCKEHNISEDQLYGREKINGDLDLRKVTGLPDGFNPTVGRSLNLSNLTSLPEGFNPTVGGRLDLSSLISLPKGLDFTVRGSLILSSLTGLPEGFKPTVGGDLWLRSVRWLPYGFNPTVGGDLCLDKVTSLPEDFNLIVGRDLVFYSLESLPEGFNLTVGGDLYMNGIKSLPEGFNPTVGGDLYLSDIKGLPKGFNPTVGGDLYLNSVKGLPEGFSVGGDIYLRHNLYKGGSELEIKDGVLMKAHFDSLSEVIIPDGVTKIASKAFDGCDVGTSSLTIPHSVMDIEVPAISGFDSLTFLNEAGLEHDDHVVENLEEAEASWEQGEEPVVFVKHLFESPVELDLNGKYDNLVRQYIYIGVTGFGCDELLNDVSSYQYFVGVNRIGIRVASINQWSTFQDDGEWMMWSKGVPAHNIRERIRVFYEGSDIVISGLGDYMFECYHSLTHGSCFKQEFSISNSRYYYWEPNRARIEFYPIAEVEVIPRGKSANDYSSAVTASNTRLIMGPRSFCTIGNSLFR